MLKATVSVCMITYGHEKYIREAIEGVLMQECDFEIELIISNDCSPDETDEVVQDFLNNHPRKSWIKYFKQDKNIGMMPNFIFALEKCSGKYVAMCEGDDFWTDSLKLQKQVEFLEKRPAYGICFHNVSELNTFDLSKNNVIPNGTHDLIYDLKDYILNNKTATCSIVLKKESLGFLPSWLYKSPFGDLAIIILVMYNSNHKGYVLKDNMGVYRIHENSVHGSLHRNNKSLIRAYLQHIEFTKLISKELLIEKKYRKIILTKMINTYQMLSYLYGINYEKFSVIKAIFWIKYFKLKIKFV